MICWPGEIYHPFDVESHEKAFDRHENADSGNNIFLILSTSGPDFNFKRTILFESISSLLCQNV